MKKKTIYSQYDEWMSNAPEFLTRIAIQSSHTATIRYLRPHYTNDTFKTPQTVYLAVGHKLTPDYVKGAVYNYSDRLCRFNYEKSQTAHEEATKLHPNTDSAAHVETYLRLLLDRPQLELVHIMAGFNVSNGYDYQIFGYFEGVATMTPSEILLKFKQTSSADFLSELEGEDLWRFLEERPYALMEKIEPAYRSLQIYGDLMLLVVAELRREVAADLDVWMNLARSDLKVKQEWIDDLEFHWCHHEPMNDTTTTEILEYLKERQVK